MAIASLSEVIAAIGLGSPTQVESDQISALLEPVTAAIERIAGRTFSNTTHVEFHQGGEPAIALRQRPVSSITAVLDTVTGEDLASYSPPDYEFEARTGLLTRLPRNTPWAKAQASPVFPIGKNPPGMRWKITYVAGEVPEDIKLVFYNAIQAQINVLDSSSGYASEKDGDYAYTKFPTATGSSAAELFSAGAIAVLNSYRTGEFI